MDNLAAVQQKVVECLGEAEGNTSKDEIKSMLFEVICERDEAEAKLEQAERELGSLKQERDMLSEAYHSAVNFIAVTPCDSDITPRQQKAYERHIRAANALQSHYLSKIESLTNNGNSKPERR